MTNPDHTIDPLDPAWDLGEAVDAAAALMRSIGGPPCQRCHSEDCDRGRAHEPDEVASLRRAAGAIVAALEQDDERPLPVALATWRVILEIPPFPTEPGDADRDTISEIVDHCTHREHATSVAWHMAHRRRDRADLVEAVGDHWDHVEAEAEHLRSLDSI